MCTCHTHFFPTHPIFDMNKLILTCKVFDLLLNSFLIHKVLAGNRPAMQSSKPYQNDPKIIEKPKIKEKKTRAFEGNSMIFENLNNLREIWTHSQINPK